MHQWAGHWKPPAAEGVGREEFEAARNAEVDGTGAAIQQ